MSYALRGSISPHAFTELRILFWLKNCDASRISAGVQFRSFAPAGPHFSKCCQKVPTTSKKTSKAFQISSQTLPKPYPNPSKTPAKSSQKASWRPCWTHVWKKQDFERPKYEQKSPKSVQKIPKTVPNPSQMRPKTLQNSFFNAFFGCFFPTPNLRWVLADFLLFVKSSTYEK